MFEENVRKFKTGLISRGCPKQKVGRKLSNKNWERTKRFYPLSHNFNRHYTNLENILMDKWHLIQNQPLPREIFREPPLISYRKGKPLKDMFVKAKL